MGFRIKYLLSCLLVGVIGVGLAWAGSGLTPVRSGEGTNSAGASGEGVPAPPAPTLEAEIAERPGPGSSTGLLAGAAKVSIEPRPKRFGGVWKKKGCATFGDDAPEAATHVADFRVRWPENPNCIYMGGYGIGPMNPITSWKDPYGLWVRSLALSDGRDTTVLTLIDGTSYFGRYNSMCDGCGAFDLAQSLGRKLDIDPGGFMFASTHSHTAPDFIGGWGGVPQWYMDQIESSIKRAVKSAVQSLRPATLEIGEVLARPFNAERRDFYRSAEEQQLTWFRVLDAAGARAIATVGAYAAHPVTADASAGIGDADFPAVFSARVEDEWGGIGLLVQTGLGNISPRGDKEEIGAGLARLVPPIGGGRMIEKPDVAVAAERWDQPVTNSGLTALGVPGFFDRPFTQTPAEVNAGKDDGRRCRSASPVSVETGVSVARIGPLWISGGPGELFSNLTNSIKEANPTGVTMPLSQVNDGLGYIMQSFETDHAGRQALGFVGKPAAEYEDAYSIDACFGDKVLETTLQLFNRIARK